MKKKLLMESNVKNISDLCKTFQEKFNKSVSEVAPFYDCDLKKVPFRSSFLELPWRPLCTKTDKGPFSSIKKDKEPPTLPTDNRLSLSVGSETELERKKIATRFLRIARSEPFVIRSKMKKKTRAAKKLIFLESAFVSFSFVPYLRNTFDPLYKVPLREKRNSTLRVAFRKDHPSDSDLGKKVSSTKGPSAFILTARPKIKKRGSPFAPLGVKREERSNGTFVGLRNLFISFCFTKGNKQKNGEPFLEKRTFVKASPLPVGGLAKQLRGLKKRSYFYPKLKKERFLKPLVFFKKRKGSLAKKFAPFDFKLKEENFFKGSSFLRRARSERSRRPATNEPAFFLSIAKKKETARPLQQGSNLEYDIRKPYRRTPPFFSYWLLPFVGLLTLIPDSKVPTLPTDLKLDTLLFNIKNEVLLASRYPEEAGSNRRESKKENLVSKLSSSFLPFPSLAKRAKLQIRIRRPLLHLDEVGKEAPSVSLPTDSEKRLLHLDEEASVGEKTSLYFAAPSRADPYVFGAFEASLLHVFPKKIAPFVFSDDAISLCYSVKKTSGFAKLQIRIRRPLLAIHKKQPLFYFLPSVKNKESKVKTEKKVLLKTQVNTKRPFYVNKLEFPTLSYTKAYLLLENIMKKQINGLFLSNRKAVARRGPLCTKGATSFFFKKAFKKSSSFNSKSKEELFLNPILFSHLRLKSRAFQPFFPKGRRVRCSLSKNALKKGSTFNFLKTKEKHCLEPQLKKKHTRTFVRSKESESNLRFSKSPYLFWRRLQTLNASIKKSKKPISFLISETELLKAVFQKNPRVNRTLSAKKKELQNKFSKSAFLFKTSLKKKHFPSPTLREATNQNQEAPTREKRLLYLDEETSDPLLLREASKQGSLGSKKQPLSYIKKAKHRISLRLLNQLALFRDLISDSTPPVFESLLSSQRKASVGNSPNSIPPCKENSLQKKAVSYAKSLSRFSLSGGSGPFLQKQRDPLPPDSEKRGLLIHLDEVALKQNQKAERKKGVKKKLLTFFFKKQEGVFDRGEHLVDEFGKKEDHITGHHKLIQGVQSLKNSLDQIFVSSSLKNTKIKLQGQRFYNEALPSLLPSLCVGSDSRGKASLSFPLVASRYLEEAGRKQTKGLLKIGTKQNMKDNKKIIEDSYTAWLQNEFDFLDNTVKLASPLPIEGLKGNAHKGGTLYQIRCPSFFHSNKKTTSRVIKMQHPILISGYTFAAQKKFFFLTRYTAFASEPKVREENLFKPLLTTRATFTKVLKSRAFQPLPSLLSEKSNSKQGVFEASLASRKRTTRVCDFKISKSKASLISNLFAHSFLNLNSSLHPSTVKEGGPKRVSPFDFKLKEENFFGSLRSPLLSLITRFLRIASVGEKELCVAVSRYPKEASNEIATRALKKREFFSKTPWLLKQAAHFFKATESQRWQWESKRTLNFVHSNREAIKITSIKKVRGALFAALATRSAKRARHSTQEWTPFKSIKEKETHHLRHKIIRIRKGEIKIRIDKLFRCFLFPAPYPLPTDSAKLPTRSEGGQHILSTNPTRFLRIARNKRDPSFINHFLPLPLFCYQQNTSGKKSCFFPYARFAQFRRGQKLLQKSKIFFKGSHVKTLKRKAFFGALANLRKPPLFNKHNQGVLSRFFRIASEASNQNQKAPLTKAFVFIEKNQKSWVKKGNEGMFRWPHKIPRTESFPFLIRKSESKEDATNNKKEENLLFKNRFDFSKTDLIRKNKPFSFLWEKKQGAAYRKKLLQRNSGDSKNALFFSESKTPHLEKNLVKSHYNITKNAMKNSKKKRRALKQKRETGRLLKRKRFHPRPAWLRVTMHKKLLKYRHLKNNDLASYAALQKSKIFAFVLQSKKRKQPFFATQATTAEKEFYSISQSVFAAFQQGLWKSSWLRSNLNSYLRKIKTSFNIIKQTSQNSELGFSTKKIISDCFGLTQTPNAESELRFAGAFKKDSSLKWNTVLQIAEYNQITYHRIQQIITNMKHSLGREGAKRAPASLPKVSLNKGLFVGAPVLLLKEERSFVASNQNQNQNQNQKAPPQVASLASRDPLLPYEQNQKQPSSFINTTKPGLFDPKKHRPFNNAHHKLKRQATEGSASKPSKKAEPFLEPSTFSFNLFNFANTVIQTPGSLKSRIHQKLQEQPFFTIQTFGNMSQKRVYWALNKTHMWHFKNSNKKEFLWANQKQREQNRSNKTKKIINKILTLPFQAQYPGLAKRAKLQRPNQNQKGAACFPSPSYGSNATRFLRIARSEGSRFKNLRFLSPFGLLHQNEDRRKLAATVFNKNYKNQKGAEVIGLLRNQKGLANVEKWKEQNQKRLNTFFKKQEQKEIKMGDLGFLDSNGPHSNLLFMKDLFANSFKESYNLSFFEEATGAASFGEQGSLLFSQKAKEQNKKHPFEATRAFFEGERVPVFIKEHKMFLRNLKNTLRVSSPLEKATNSTPLKMTNLLRSLPTDSEKGPLASRYPKEASLGAFKASLASRERALVFPGKKMKTGRAKGALLSSLIWSSPKSYSQMGADARPWGGVEVGAKSLSYVRHNFLTAPLLRDFSFFPFACQRPLLARRNKQSEGPLVTRHTLIKKGARFMRIAIGGNYNSTPVNFRIPRPFLCQAKPREAKQKPLLSETSTFMQPASLVGAFNKPFFLRQQKGQHRGQFFMTQAAFMLCTILFHLCSLFSLVSLSQIRCVIKFFLLLAIKLSSFVKIFRLVKPFKHKTLMMAPKIRLRKVPKSSPFLSRSSLQNLLHLLPKASSDSTTILKKSSTEKRFLKPVRQNLRQIGIESGFAKQPLLAILPFRFREAASRFARPKGPRSLLHQDEVASSERVRKQAFVLQSKKAKKGGGLKNALLFELKRRAFFRQGAKKMPLAFFLTTQLSSWQQSSPSASWFFDKQNEKGAAPKGSSATKLNTFLKVGSKKLGFVLHTGLSKVTDIRNTSTKSASVFLGKPGESLSVWINHLFLIEIAADSTITIPENSDSSLWTSYAKLAKSSSTIPILGTLLEKGLLSSFEFFLERVSQPDTDLIVRQRKGTIFLDNLLFRTSPTLKNVSESAERPSLRGVLSSFVALPSRFLRIARSGYFILMKKRAGQRGEEASVGSNPLLFRRSAAALQLKELQNLGNSKVFSLDVKVRKRWSANQFITFKGKDSDLLIHAPPAPKSFHSLYPSPFLLRPSTSKKNANHKTGSLASLASRDLLLPYGQNHWPPTRIFLAKAPTGKLLQHHYNFNAEGIAPLGTIVCQIYSGLFSKETAKSCLVVGSKSSNYDEKSLLIQSLAGETEMKIIRDNANRYNFALGIKSLRNVFDALALHTPCIFLIEDIHVIGGRRPLLVGDDENALFGREAATRASGESHDEKNLSVAKLTRHSIMHYRKPFRGDFSSLIPANNFSFDLFLENDLITQAPTLVATKTTFFKPKNSVDELPWMGGLVLFQKSTSPLVASPTNQNQKAPFSLLRSLLHQDEETSSEKFIKMKRGRSSPPTIFSKEPEVQKGLLKIKNSIRVKIALLANLAVSNLSVKLNMITDLLVIIDGVRSNRGFVVFATTHIPSSLDPALRRPGRLDETIVLPFLPKLESRWEIVKAKDFESPSCSASLPQIIRGGQQARSEAIASSDSFFYKSGGCFATPSLSLLWLRSLVALFKDKGPFVIRAGSLCQGAPLAFLPLRFGVRKHPKLKEERFLSSFGLSLASRFLRIARSERRGKSSPKGKNLRSQMGVDALCRAKLQRPNQNQNQNQKGPLLHFDEEASERRRFCPTLLYPKSELESEGEGKNKSEQHEVYPISRAESSSPNLPNLIAIAYSKIGTLLINNTNCASPLGQFVGSSSSSSSSSSSAETNFSLFSTFHSQLENQHIHEPYLHLYTTQSIVKQYLMGLFAPKVAETFAFSGLIKKRSLQKITGPLLLATLVSRDRPKGASSLIFTLIEKRLIYKKNVIIPRLLQFYNAALLSLQEPSCEASFLLLPAKRYENYKQTFSAMQKLKPVSLPLGAELKVSNVGPSDSDVGESQSILPPQRGALGLLRWKQHLVTRGEEYFDNPTAFNKLFRSQMLNRHRGYLNNQWWNGQLYEHNVETTFLSDIDWRSNCFASKKGRPSDSDSDLKGEAFQAEETTPAKKWENFYVDFPDFDQHYNPGNRRWVLHFGYWSYWSDFKTEHSSKIYSFMAAESFLETFNYLNSRREIVDYFVTKLIKTGSLKDINVIDGKKRF